MKPADAMRATKMTVFKRARGTRYLMRWTDPDTGMERERSTRATAQRDAQQIAAEQAVKIMAGRSTDDPFWDDFCELYESHVESRRSGRATEPWLTAKRWINGKHKRAAGIRPPLRLSELTARWVLTWQAKLRSAGLADNTIASHSARLKAALRWAARHGMIDAAPVIDVERHEAPRSRAITLEEFERILAAVPQVRPADSDQWQRLLRGQWCCGYRISELMNLSWNDEDPIHLDNRGKFPYVMLAAQANKKRKPRLRAITPEFWAVCCETPVEDRRDRVFPIVGINGRQMSKGRIVRTIGQFGKKAGVITNTETRKTATSHDTRRGFAVQMDKRGLTLAELQKWMDHQDIRTTLTFYRTAEAEELAAKVWAANG